MAELIEHGLSFTEQRADGPHKLGKRAVVIGAGIGGLATAGALAPYFEQVDILERDRLAAIAGSRSGTPQDRHPHGLLAGGLHALDQIFLVSRAVSPRPAAFPSRSCGMSSSSGPMSACCRSGILESRCFARRGR